MVSKTRIKTFMIKGKQYNFMRKILMDYDWK